MLVEMEIKMRDFLQRCFNVIWSNIFLAIYIAIWLFIVGDFWFIPTNSAAFGYAVLSFYLILPVCALVVNLVYGMREDSIKYYLPFFFGVMEILGGFLSFQLANIVANGKWNTWNTPDLEMGLYSFVPALQGLVIGLVIRWIRRRMAVKKK